MLFTYLPSDNYVIFTMHKLSPKIILYGFPLQMDIKNKIYIHTTLNTVDSKIFYLQRFGYATLISSFIRYILNWCNIIGW